MSFLPAKEICPLSLKMLNRFLWVLNFSVLFLPVMLSQTKSNYWRLCIIWLHFIVWKYKRRDFFSSMPLLIELVLFQLFTFNYFALSCCFVSSVYMKLLLTSTLTIFCHPNVKLLTSTVVSINRAMDYWIFQVLTHFNSIPFFPNVLWLEASYTL